MNTELMLEGILAQLQAMEEKLQKPKVIRKISPRQKDAIYRSGMSVGFSEGIEFYKKHEKEKISRESNKAFTEGYKKGFAEAKIYSDPLPDHEIHQIRVCAVTS